MALAACGGPTYVDRFRDLIQLLPNGQFRINRDYISFDTHGLVRPFKWKFYETFGPPRSRKDPLTDHHRDIAHALQVHDRGNDPPHRPRYGKAPVIAHLVISGGVGLNCVANARILRDTNFERVWVPPCASDTGAPLGSALWHWHQTLGNPRTFEMKHAFYGKGFTDAEIKAALDKAGMAYKKFEEPELLQLVAKLLSEQKSSVGSRAAPKWARVHSATVRSSPMPATTRSRISSTPRSSTVRHSARSRGRSARTRAGIFRGLPARSVHDAGPAHPPRQSASDPRRRPCRRHRPHPDNRALR